MEFIEFYFTPGGVNKEKSHGRLFSSEGNYTSFEGWCFTGIMKYSKFEDKLFERWEE